MSTVKGSSLYSKKTTARVKRFVVFLILSLVVTSILGSAVITARAESSYGSWLVNDPVASYNGEAEEGPSSGARKDASDDVEQKKNVSTVESMAAWLIAEPGYVFDQAIRSTKIDASVAGIVMGRVSGGNSFFQFDLTDNNIYGKIGATIYVGIRALAMTALIFFVLINIIKSLFYSDVKSFSEMKKAIMGGIIAIIVMLIMPQIVDWLCSARDVLSLWLYDLAKDFAGGTNDNIKVSVNLVDDYRQQYEQHSDLVNAIIYSAVCFLPVTWIVNYVKIAITELVLFGSFPMFCAMASKDKKALSNWASVFFTNLFIPSIDLTLLFIPQLLIKSMEEIAPELLTAEANTAQSVGWTLLKAVITITTFMFIIPARDKLLNMLGNHLGIPMGGGLFAAGAAIGGAASAAAGAVKDLAGGIGGMFKKDGPDGGGSPEDGDTPDGGADNDPHISNGDMKDVESSPEDNAGNNEMPDDGLNGDDLENKNEENAENGEEGDGLSEEEQQADNENEAIAEGEDAADAMESDQAAEEESAEDEMQEEAELDEGNVSDGSSTNENEIGDSEDIAENESGSEADVAEIPDESSDMSSNEEMANATDADGSADTPEASDTYDTLEASDTPDTPSAGNEAGADMEGEDETPEMGNGIDEIADGTADASVENKDEAGNKDGGEMPEGGDMSEGGDDTLDESAGAGAEMPSDTSADGTAGDDSMTGEEPGITDGQPADMHSEDDSASNNGDISEGEPVDMPSEGNETSDDIGEASSMEMPDASGSVPVSDDVRNDVDETIAGASVSSSDLEGNGDMLGRLEDKTNKALGDMVKDNSPADMKDLNMDRAANLKTMDNLRDEMGQLDSKNTALEADAGNIRAQMAENNAEIQNTRDAQKEFLKTAPRDANNNLTEAAKRTNEEFNRKAEVYRKDNMELAKAGAGIEKDIAHNNSVKAGLSQELARRGNTEKQFAAKASQMTGNGQVFRSSADMTASLKHDSNMRKMATYKNYNAAEFKGTMSNQQRAEFAKNQRRAEAAGKVASGAAKAARAYATAVATVAMMGGGADAAMNANKTIRKATSGWADSARDKTEYVVSGEALKDAKAVAAGTKKKVTAIGNGAKAAGQALKDGTTGRVAVDGTYAAARAGKNAAQAVAQTAVNAVTSIPKIPGKAMEGARAVANGTKEMAVNNFNEAKDQIKKERAKSAPGPVGKSKGPSDTSAKAKTAGGSKVNFVNLDTGKKKTVEFGGHQKKSKSDKEKASEYTSQNIDMDDPVNASREKAAANKAKNNVKNFKKNK